MQWVFIFIHLPNPRTRKTQSLQFSKLPPPSPSPPSPGGLLQQKTSQQWYVAVHSAGCFRAAYRLLDTLSAAAGLGGGGQRAGGYIL